MKYNGETMSPWGGLQAEVKDTALHIEPYNTVGELKLLTDSGEEIILDDKRISANGVKINSVAIKPYKIEFHIYDGLINIYNLTDVSVSGLGKTKLSNANNIIAYDNIMQNLTFKATGESLSEGNNGFAAVMTLKSGTVSGQLYGYVIEASISGHSIIQNFTEWIFSNIYMAPVSIITIVFSGAALLLAMHRETK